MRTSSSPALIHEGVPHGMTEYQQFHSQLIGALRTLQTLQARSELAAPLVNPLTCHERYPSPTDAEVDQLIHALDNGGIQIVAGSFSVTLFKRSAKKSPCKRR